MRALALQAHAAPGMILCSDATAHLVQEAVRIEVAASIPMAGDPTPAAAYTVLGQGRRRPFRALIGRRLAPFVGRRRQLETLRHLLTQVEEGRGQVVGMIGEPGVGKSRLCYEFLCGSLSHPWVILEAQGTAYGAATPYLPVIDPLKSYFHIEARDALSTILAKVTAKLRGLDKTLMSTLPAFLTLLDVPVQDPPWRALEASQRRQRTLDALKRILLRESQVQPLLLVVENLHCIDDETQQVLDTLVESLPAARLLLLTTYRPKYRHAWGSKSYYMQLRLDPLPRERAQELVEALLGGDAALEPVKQHLIERAQGNPLFLEESIRTLVETQVLVGCQGAYCLDPRLRETPRGRPESGHHMVLPLPIDMRVPATVQTILAARIDRLPPEEKQLLQTAAVIGTEVPFPLLQAVADQAEEELRAGLAHLKAAEFLYETRHSPELEYTFKHMLTHEVAYGNLLPDRRRMAHARIVEALEALGLERMTEYVNRLAHHALRGEVWEKAVRYCRQAGERARNRGSWRNALTNFEQALDALSHLPEHPDSGELGIELHHRLGGLGEAYALTGRLAEGLALLEEVRRDDLHTGRLGSSYVTHLQHLSAVCLVAGRVDDAWQHACQALDLARQSKIRGNEALALFRIGAIHAHADPPDAAPAEAPYHQALDLAGELGMRPLQAHCHHGLGTLNAKIGRPEQARAELATGIELYRAMEMTFWLPQAEAALTQIRG